MKKRKAQQRKNYPTQKAKEACGSFAFSLSRSFFDLIPVPLPKFSVPFNTSALPSLA
jgi:hypothetical protein